MLASQEGLCSMNLVTWILWLDLGFTNSNEVSVKKLNMMIRKYDELMASNKVGCIRSAELNGSLWYASK
jgi:hypothetical protein